MNKSVLNIFISVLLCGITALTNVSAQDYKRWAIGIDAGTTGIGFEVAHQLHQKIAIRGGFSTLPYSYNTKFGVDIVEQMKTDLTTAMSNPNVEAELKKANLPTNVNDINKDVNVKSSLGLLNGKLLMDIYPFDFLSLHFTCGLFFGNNKLINVKGGMNKEVYGMLNVVSDNAPAPYNNLIDKPFIDDFEITGRDILNMNAAFSINSVKPYIGIGFGRAVPKRRVSSTFQFGFMFHGTPAITSENPKVQKMIDRELDGGITDIVNKLTFWPVMSYRLSIALF